MKTKHIAIITLLSALITSTPCSAEKSNPITTMIYGNMIRARDWTSNFFKSCWNIGILATLYARFGKYDFKKISGLDENALDTYDVDQLKDAQRRAEKMILYTSPSPSTQNELNKISLKIQEKIHQKEHDAQAATEEAKRMEEFHMTYDEAKVEAEIEEMIKTNKKNKK